MNSSTVSCALAATEADCAVCAVGFSFVAHPVIANAVRPIAAKVISFLIIV
jgi:hypothetical protein